MFLLRCVIGYSLCIMQCADWPALRQCSPQQIRAWRAMERCSGCNATPALQYQAVPSYHGM